ncbi:MAG TPA: hypothetical protein P5328_02045 [Candidatus Paceibacterota bacterium]|nr:hypothetical protein [Candidatus Paceibacterota bacterium]HRZ34466.1 hypothetical protein [Candidatus Paceibacterota bacterium]
MSINWFSGSPIPELKHISWTPEAIEGRIVEKPMPIKCKVCEKDTGKSTHVIGDNWTTCSDCKTQKERDQKAIDEANKERARISRELNEMEKSGDENWHMSSKFDEFSRLGDKIAEMEKAFSKKYYGW